LHHHHDAYRVFPSNGGWDGKQQIPTVSGGQTLVETIEKSNPQGFIWGVGVPNLRPQDQTGSWAYAILPYMEQENMYRQRDWQQPLPLYYCPSRRQPVAQEAFDDEYGTYLGGGWQWGKTDYAANALVIPNRPKCLSIAGIRDGTAYTILVGEKAMDPKNYDTGTWYWDEPFFTGGNGGTQRDGSHVLRDTKDVDFVFNWGSAHPGGAQFLFADGSVRMIPYDTPQDTVKALLTPDGGEPAPDF
jgi:prepilin-type processing-associated H-X9-DG protein